MMAPPMMPPTAPAATPPQKRSPACAAGAVATTDKPITDAARPADMTVRDMDINVFLSKASLRRDGFNLMLKDGGLMINLWQDIKIYP
jgi:hypothetical protein